jgi:hypothetical protein
MGLFGRSLIALMIISFDIINTVKAPDSHYPHLPKGCDMEDISKSQIETVDFHLKCISREEWNINFYRLEMGIKTLSYEFEVLKDLFLPHHHLSMAG